MRDEDVATALPCSCWMNLPLPAVLTSRYVNTERTNACTTGSDAHSIEVQLIDAHVQDYKMQLGHLEWIAGRITFVVVHKIIILITFRCFASSAVSLFAAAFARYDMHIDNGSGTAHTNGTVDVGPLSYQLETSSANAATANT